MIRSQENLTTSRHALQAGPLWEAAQQLGIPAAAWRLPGQSEVKLLLSLKDSIDKRTPDLETLPPCFVLHPFEGEPGGEALVLEGDLIFSFSESGDIEGEYGNVGEEHAMVKKLFVLAAEIAGEEADTGRSKLPNETVFQHEIEEGEAFYKNIVAQALESIHAGRFSKVVLSRTKSLKVPQDFSLFAAFKKLCRAYPTAFVSLVHLPERGEQWLGASPEILVGMGGEGTFRTTALAGTQASVNQDGPIPVNSIRWGQKEIEEQALVSRYIIDCFKKIRLREYEERGPKTVLAGNLYHLRTDYAVATREVNFPELGTVMLKLLHPTSAVCGMPKDAALRFVKSMENYDRSFYSGYLGPVNIAGESNLFVNLRTMRIAEGRATLFAGAGITEDSDPQSEWNETEMKCDTLLRVLE